MDKVRSNMLLESVPGVLIAYITKTAFKEELLLKETGLFHAEVDFIHSCKT